MAFYGLPNLESVTLADSVTEIRGYAFKNCSALTSVTGTAGLEIVREGAFYGCSDLTAIELPEGCVVEAYVFGGSCPIE